ncbi:MAG: hypothetical protein EAZ55_01370 [Cytophagales bacterium]|nr:MAG: hypothetical protein EAZ55_01370 [Cytophagales bacterium]
MNYRHLLPHIWVVLGFVVLSFLYVLPILEGKTLAQTDIIQASGAAQELKNYEKDTQKKALWTNSMFAGMPAYMIYMDYPYSWSVQVGRVVSYWLPSPANVIWVYLMGFYLMMIILGFDIGISVLGAIAFAFSSYNIISIEAGHTSKALAIGFAPPFIASVIYTYRSGKYALGAVLAGFFSAIHLYANHMQITYYALLALFLYIIYEIVITIKEKKWKNFAYASAVLGITGALSIATHTSRLWTTYEFQGQTIRGKSELTTNNQSTGGLDRDYAFQWSYGMNETFTFLIPNYYGGTSGGKLTKSSKIYKTLVSNGVPEETAESVIAQLPLYWGSQPFTLGPAYLGAIICFLFFLGLVIIRDTLKWWLLSVVILFVMLAWGSNFALFNDFFFDYVPLYNKFRAVTMILCVIQIFTVLMAALTLQRLMEIFAINNTKPDVATLQLQQNTLKSIYYVGGALGAFLLFMAVIGSGMMSFSGEGDKSYQEFLLNASQSEDFAQKVMRALLADRAWLMQADAWRSFFFVLGAVGVLWAYATRRLATTWSMAVLIVLVLADLWLIDRRYLNNDNFITRSQYKEKFEQTPADITIKEDKDPHYRVINLDLSTFNDATTSIHHKSIGGYHGAKLRRFNELIEFQIAKQNVAVLDMLNTKYFIQKGAAQRNPNATGNAWFVEKYTIVPNADAEMKAISKFDPKKEAFIDQRYAAQLKNLTLKKDEKATIRLVSYAPDELKYESNAQTTQLAIFSEIYYNQGLGWQAYIDGTPVEHFRANYVLRAITVPAGKHQITFRFEPKSYYLGSQIDLAASILLFGGMVIILFIHFRKQNKNDESQSTKTQST